MGTFKKILKVIVETWSVIETIQKQDQAIRSNIK